MSRDHVAVAGPSIRLGTMGMFITDTFQYFDAVSGEDLGNKGLQDQIGGGGCYFAIGARIWMSPGNIQMIIDRGNDWKPENQAVLDKYDRSEQDPSDRSMWYYRSRPDGTTRAVNIYRGDHRGFDYLSPKIRLEPKDLLQCSPSQPSQLPEWVHLICSPERAQETLSQIDHIVSTTAEKAQPHRRPKLIYEPIPDSCILDNLETCIKVVPHLAVFSPNHEEAASLLGLSEEWNKLVNIPNGSSKSVQTEEILEFIEQKLARGFVHLMEKDGLKAGSDAEGADAGYGPIICIRSGAWGSVIGRAGVGFYHVPAWHTDEEMDASLGRGLDHSTSKIKDVTGAGNSFLGGLGAYLVLTEDGGGSRMSPEDKLMEAAMHGSVSASFIIEQLGLPNFELKKGGIETWNGEKPQDRLDTLGRRLRSRMPR